MEKQAVLFIDVDETEQGRYYYREPHFAAARKRDFYCLTAARKGRSYLERLYSDSDQVFLLDEITEDTIVELVTHLNRDYKIKVLFCYGGQATRYGQTGVIVANACQKLGLVYSDPDGINACNNKYMMRQKLERLGVPSVRYALCHNEKQLMLKAEEIGYPLIAKPPFGAGSAFIKKCANEQELLQHYAIYQSNYDRSLSADFFGRGESNNDTLNIPGSTILLESWIDGIEGTVECVICGDVIYPVIINEKLILTDAANTVLENLLITPPVSFAPAQQQAIRDYAKRCLHAVGLTHAIAHLEFRMSAEGPIVIEINPRIGGLYVSSAFEDIAKISPWALYLDILLDNSDIAQRLVRAANAVEDCPYLYSMMVIYPHKKGIFKGFTDLAVLAEDPAVIDYSVFPAGSSVNPDLEEFYLLKCWVRVTSAEAAKALYRKISECAIPVIE